MEVVSQEDKLLKTLVLQGNKKLEWNHVEYLCSEQTISDKLINKMVNRL